MNCLSPVHCIEPIFYYSRGSIVFFATWNKFPVAIKIVPGSLLFEYNPRGEPLLPFITSRIGDRSPNFVLLLCSQGIISCRIEKVVNES